ncbi:MAG: TonB family protein [Azospirillum sp.]|nr:TonB family protein [Azospirillum sp.]
MRGGASAAGQSLAASACLHLAVLILLLVGTVTGEPGRDGVAPVVLEVTMVTTATEPAEEGPAEPAAPMPPEVHDQPEPEPPRQSAETLSAPPPMPETPPPAEPAPLPAPPAAAEPVPNPPKPPRRAVKPASSRPAVRLRPRRENTRPVENRPIRPSEAASGPTAAGDAAVQAAIDRLNAYGALVHRLVTERKPAGISLGGTAVVTFTIAPSGALVSAELTISSGQAVLDQAALDALNAAAPFPPPPAEAAAAPLTFSIAFHYL